MIEFEEYNKPLTRTQEFLLTNVILDILIKRHVGKSKAITAVELVADIQLYFDQDIDVRQLRQAICKLRMKGYPVCSCSKGYYYVDEPFELECTIQSLTERLKALAALIVAMSAKYREVYGKYPFLVIDDLEENIEKIVSPPLIGD